MSERVLTIAIPVLNGARELEQLLPALHRQQITTRTEIVIADSESDDGSAELARAHGATVIPVKRASFSHGGTRNLLMESSHGDLVAFLTQDALPADDQWLAQLTSVFATASDVALAFGPGIARPDASLTVRRELTDYFGGLSPDGSAVIARLRSGTAYGSSSSTYFHSVNACVARDAWSEIPFRVIPYAEDRMLALDMLRAGWGKAFVPSAAVVHSHDYRPLDLFRRSFDEWRGLREVAGHREPIGVRTSLDWILGQVTADIAFAEREGASRWECLGALPASLRHACLRHAGAVLGSRAPRLRPRLRRLCSLEQRETFLAQQPRPESELRRESQRAARRPEVSK